MQEEGVEGDTDPWDPEQTTREGNATGSSKPEVDRKSNMTGTLEVKNTSVVMVKEDAALSNRGYEELSLNGKSDEAIDEPGTRDKPRERKNEQTTMLDHYRQQTQDEHRMASTAAFRVQGRQVRRNRRRADKEKQQRRSDQHKHDCTIGLTTLNVRGLASCINNLESKLQGLKEKHVRGNRDVIFIQETHLHQTEHEAAARQHVAMWGFNHTMTNKSSFWASGNDRRAGVAILVNPYGAITNVQAWQEDQWSEHVVMVTGELDGKKLLFINIYAPVNGAVRVQFYRKLKKLKIPEETEIICGGDFNCVDNNGIDRIGGSTKAELGTRELNHLMAEMGLQDAGETNIPSVQCRRRVHAYAAAHHTHFHKASSGQRGSTRLDRFYVGHGAKPLVRGVETEEALRRTDYLAVLLELHSPKGVIRVQKRRKLYPPPAYVQTATHDLVAHRIAELQVQLVNTPATDSAKAWETFKQQLKHQMTQLKRAARLKMTHGYRQRIQRIILEFTK
ncbi:hypothetical protein PF010_g19882 [Phytophthora fragariae]|uniref:Endonuclease/exonuclease/phosphatase domain-containing protein n=1 Tax=Phytophthora fragariae TaxID=53985 RepID=A0A6G0KGU8_9STRA|nr:hypothetical protein PF010_g19882 [Phytophthora fragariae]KAE9199122.1 hypothetical protein PF004_g19351 [Phytophthora fragariae]